MKKSCKLNKLMLDFQNQRGFSTLEVILVIMIISLLATVILPNMARMVDVAQVDYEMKIFLSTLDYAKSMDKNSYFKPEIFKGTLANNAGAQIFLNVDYNKGTYQIVRKNVAVGEMHELPEGFKIISENGIPSKIDPQEKYSGHIRITSRQNSNRYIISDSAGRWRGSLTPP